MANLKPLPDFAVIGAMRAGKTFLYHELSKLSSFCLPTMKETDYFIEEYNYKRGAKWYRNLFPEIDKACGDISPNYTKSSVFKGAAKRLYDSNPDAKIIYIVRDPVERALSHYNFRGNLAMLKKA